MKKEIRIKAEYNNFPLDLNVSKVNDLIRTLVYDLKKLGLDVTDYTRLEQRMVKPDEKNEK